MPPRDLTRSQPPRTAICSTAGLAFGRDVVGIGDTGVLSVTAVEPVLVFVASQVVVAVVAGDLIEAVAAEQAFVPAPARHDVVTGAPEDLVASLSALEVVVAGYALDVV